MCIYKSISSTPMDNYNDYYSSSSVSGYSANAEYLNVYYNSNTNYVYN